MSYHFTRRPGRGFGRVSGFRRRGLGQDLSTRSLTFTEESPLMPTGEQAYRVAETTTRTPEQTIEEKDRAYEEAVRAASTTTREAEEPVLESMVAHPVLSTRTPEPAPPPPTVRMEPMIATPFEPTPPPPSPTVRMEPMIATPLEPTPPPPSPTVRMEPMTYEQKIEPTPPPPTVRMEPMIATPLEPTPPPPERTGTPGVMEPAEIAPEDAVMMREMQSRTEPTPPPVEVPSEENRDMPPYEPVVETPAEPTPPAPTEPTTTHPVVGKSTTPATETYVPDTFVPFPVGPLPAAAPGMTTTEGSRSQKPTAGGAAMTPEQAAAERTRLLMLQKKGSAILPIALATGLAALLFKK